MLPDIQDSLFDDETLADIPLDQLPEKKRKGNGGESGKQERQPGTLAKDLLIIRKSDEVAPAYPPTMQADEEGIKYRVDTEHGNNDEGRENIKVALIFVQPCVFHTTPR